MLGGRTRMKATETGKDKVRKICDVLKKETLEPALKEAEEIVVAAKGQAEQIIAAAKRQATALKEEAGREIERQKNVFHSSLSQACKQALEALKQDIEQKLFNKQLAALIRKETQNPHVLGELITAVVKGIEKEGIDVVLSAYIPAVIPARSVNALLIREILEKLREKGVLIGPITGGIEVKLHKENITIDLSDKALEGFVAQYIRKDFREMLFG